MRFGVVERIGCHADARMRGGGLHGGERPDGEKRGGWARDRERILQVASANRLFPLSRLRSAFSRAVLRVTIGIALVITSGCRGVDTRVHWYFERMIVQHKYMAFREGAFFTDGRAMRPPPGGTIPRGTIVDQPLLTQGIAGGQFATTIPVPVTIEMLELGRKRFDITCAACHGIAGDGASVVATKMQLRRPPSLHQAEIVAYTPGQIYQVLNEGFGLMPSYATMLTLEERWAVVAYVKALQLGQSAVVGDLPEPVRGDMERALAEPVTR